MADKFSKSYSSINGPMTKAAVVSPSNTVDLTQTSRAIYVGVTGDIQVTFSGDAAGTSVILKAVPVGMMREVRIARVWLTGTTATNIISLS